MLIERFRDGHEERFRDPGTSLRLLGGVLPGGSRLGAALGDGADGEPGKGDSRKPVKFEAVAFTGVCIGRGWGQMIVNSAGVKRDSSSAMLLEHNDQAATAVCTDHDVDKKGVITLRGDFLSPRASRYSEEVIRLAEEGWPWKMSIGIRFLKHSIMKHGEEVEANGRAFKFEQQNEYDRMVYVEESHLFETSFIYCSPADLATSAAMLSHGSRLGLSSGEADRLKESDMLIRGRRAFFFMAPDKDVPIGGGSGQLPTGAPPAGSANPVPANTGASQPGVRAYSQADVDALTARAKSDGERGATESRAKLESDLTAAFPGRPKFVRACLTKGMSVDQAKLADYDRAQKKLAEREGDDATIAKLAAKSKHGGLGFDASRAHSVSQQRGVPGDTRYAGKTIAERAAIEVGEDPILQQIFGDDYATKAYGAALTYARKIHKSGKPLIDPVIRAACIAALQSCDPGAGIFGPREARLAGAGRNAPDYSPLAVDGLIGSFHQGMDEEFNGHWARDLMFNTGSTQEADFVRWLGQFPQLQPWRGARQAKNAPIYQILMVSDRYEATVDFDKMDWRLQRFGLISNFMDQGGAVAARHWELLFTKSLEANLNSYDGVAYFSGNHTLGGDSGIMANDCTSSGAGGTFAAGTLAVADPLNPTPLECARILLQITPHFRTFRANNGEPINGTAKKFVVMVHPTYEGNFFAGTRNERLDLGQTNPLFGSPNEYRVVSNARLGLFGGSIQYGYIFREDTMHKPFLCGEPGPLEMQFQGPGSHYEFTLGKYAFGLDTMRVVVGGAWESAIRFHIGAS